MLAARLAKGLGMPKVLDKPLNAKQVEALKAEGKKNRRVMVGGDECAGLHLRIEGKTKTWALRIKIGDKRRDVGLGPYNAKSGMAEEEAAEAPGLSLSEAKERARQLRRQYLKTGLVVSPTAAKLQAVRVTSQAALVEAAKTKTFKECAEAFLADNKEGWKNPKHRQQWENTLKSYVYPKLGALPVASIDAALVLEVIRPIWEGKSETASRVRGRIERVLDWSKVNKYREGENPAAWKGNLEHALSKRKKLSRGHHAALDHAKIGTFMADLRKKEGMGAKALEFAILTAARSAEVREATWAEFYDLEGPSPEWRVPEERMKAGKEHRVPLSPEAVAILKALPRVRGSNHAFPAPRGGALSDMTLTKPLKSMNFGKLTQHGFRSTFRDWAGDSGYDEAVAEHALAHQIADKAKAAYQRGSYFERRRTLMEAWAKRCSMADAVGGNVVSIASAAA
jgi:integrase